MLSFVEFLSFFLLLYDSSMSGFIDFYDVKVDLDTWASSKCCCEAMARCVQKAWQLITESALGPLC